MGVPPKGDAHNYKEGEKMVKDRRLKNQACNFRNWSKIVQEVKVRSDSLAV